MSSQLHIARFLNFGWVCNGMTSKTRYLPNLLGPSICTNIMRFGTTSSGHGETRTRRRWKTGTRKSRCRIPGSTLYQSGKKQCSKIVAGWEFTTNNQPLKVTLPAASNSCNCNLLFSTHPKKKQQKHHCFHQKKEANTTSRCFLFFLNNIYNLPTPIFFHRKEKNTEAQGIAPRSTLGSRNPPQRESGWDQPSWNKIMRQNLFFSSDICCCCCCCLLLVFTSIQKISTKTQQNLSTTTSF